MKILDRFLIRSFFPPFAVAFGIALFVLIMQFLWLYIDDIMGKGLTIFEISELLFYLSIGLVPQALPIGVLIATVMVMGNLAERYELSSFKSAGVSLLRVMRPLMLSCGLIAVFSFFTSEVLIPWSNLKFYARFYDIRKSKPALNMEEGVFNDEFSDYTLRIGKKGRDGKSLEHMMIYSNKGTDNSTVNQTIAKSGEMLNSSDHQFIVMNLKDGTQYQETTGNNGQKSGKNPFVRIKFKSWQKIFDLSEFDRRKTDEDLFKNNQKMLSSRQLFASIDSMNKIKKVYTNDLYKNLNDKWKAPQQKPIEVQMPPSMGGGKMQMIDTTPSVKTENFTQKNDIPRKTTVKKDRNSLSLSEIQKQLSVKNKQIDSFSKATLAETPFTLKTNISVVKDTFKNKYLTTNFYDITKNMVIYEVAGLRQKAETKAQDANSQVENTLRQIKITTEQRGKFEYELHMKYTAALICFIFLFIGAPMGAIIQKGGFGYPILVAIGFFVVYIIGTIYCKNIKDAGFMLPHEAAWYPVFMMVPIALLLTWRAVNDYKMSFDGVTKTVMTLLKKLMPRRFKSDTI